MRLITEDRLCILNDISALEAYRDCALSLVRRRYALFSKMPVHHREIAADVGYLDRLREIEVKIISNATVISDLAQYARRLYAVKDYEFRSARPVSNSHVIELMHQIVRDWSRDLEIERRQLFAPLLNSLQNEFSLASRSFARVLVPGSGLARAAYEISLLGFQTKALEYSHLMDMAAQFMFDMNNNSRTNFELFPYVHDFSHQSTAQHQLRNVVLPDLPGPLKKPANLTLGYGDFTELMHTEPKSYDAIVTLYLIDTAENALQYLDAIRVLLKPGGIWINYGPLKWGTAPQVEFTLEEIEMVVSKLNFTIEQKFSGVDEYNGDNLSLWQGLYKIRGWVARKNYC